MSQHSSNFKRITLSVMLITLMLLSTMPVSNDTILESHLPSASTSGADMVDYELYVAGPNSSAGGDGFITTERPDTGGQEDASAIDGIEFRSGEMISDMLVKGTSVSGNEIWIYYFLQFVGQEGSTADVTFALEAGGTQIASKTVNIDDPCQSGGLGQSCAYHGRDIVFDTIPVDGFTVESGKQLVLTIDGSASCEGGGGGFPGSNDCDVRVAFDNVDNADGFTRIEVRTNAMANSQVRIHRPGGSWNDAEVIEWAPNHFPEYREMQFSIDVRNSFGRYDIQQVKLVMESPGGTSYPFEKIFSDNELKLDNDGLVGNYSWTYNAGIVSGDYGLTLEITDLQGHLVIVEHSGIEMVDVGIFLDMGPDQSDSILVAPGMTSTAEFRLDHVGSNGIDMQVEMSPQRSFGDDWVVEFDQPAGYELTGGGAFARPILSITAPDDDLSGAPDVIDIIARAYADEDGDGTEEEVQVITISLDIEEVGVFAYPRVNIYEDEDHQMEIADSARPEAYDEGVSHFVDSDQTGRFWLDLQNAGFDQDTFRIKVKDIPDQWDVSFFDNLTNSELEKQQGAWVTPSIGSHSVETFMLEVYPPAGRDGEDLGVLEIEVASSGDSELQSIVRYTVHRTFGVYAEVIYDPFGTPDGHIGPFETTCESISTTCQLDLTVRITAQDGNGSAEVSSWQIRDPSTLEKNLEVENGAYSRWEWGITFSGNGSIANRVDLAQGTNSDINLQVSYTRGLKAGNHTMYLRIIEEGAGADARYFDLPLTFEIEVDMPDDIQITQKSEPAAFYAGDSREMSFKVYNGNNVDLTLLLDVDIEGDWGAEIKGNQVLSVPAFSEANFSLLILAPDALRHGDVSMLTITVRPLDSEISFDDEYTVRKKINLQGEATGMDRIMGEVTQPRAPTIIAFVALVFLAGMAFNRRKKDVEIIEEWIDDEDEFFDDPKSDIPEPILEDDDLELLDEGLDDL
jgi:hypothetical protein